MNMREMIKRIPFAHAAGRAWNDFMWLQKARRNETYAQNGEDKVVRELFPKDYRGKYIDLGANHPYRISNTYLLYTLGWSGLCVDPVPMFAPLYRRYRPRDRFLNVGVGASRGHSYFFEMSPTELSTFSQPIADELVQKKRASLVGRHTIETMTVSEITATLAPDGRFDLLSIDIEGLDAEIVRQTDWTFVRPKVVICETSAYEHDWAGEIAALFRANGYQHHAHVGCNDFFLRGAN